MLKKFFILIIIILFSLYIYPQSVRISQIDNSKLLLNQDIKLYISVASDRGVPVKNLTKDMFEVYESVDNNEFKKVELTGFQQDANILTGINFLLLLDNSGSMYRDMNGNSTKDESKMRITYAKNAVESFLNSVTNQNDKVGIAAYNSYYTLYNRPMDDKSKVREVLENIARPDDDQKWTEIYSSLYLAINDFSSIKGRKVIIILSDGENMPYYKWAKKPHKDFGEKIFEYTEPIEESNKEGVSIFAVNFSTRGGATDKNLRKIANETGGTTFDAYNQDELKSIYKIINDLVLNEYLLTYKATMDPADKKYVKVNFKFKGSEKNASRFYYSSTIFGMPLKNFNPLLLLAFLLACLLLYLLSLIKFKNTNTEATLEVLSTQVGKAVTQVVTLTGNKTVIGGSTNANMTIMGSPTMKDNHATIIYDNKTNQYTIVADADLSVNNKTIKSKVLEDGDVINAGGATIVFDKGMMDKKKKGK